MKYQDNLMSKWLIALMPLAILMLMPEFGWGQEDGSEKSDETFFDLFNAGGFTMYILTALSMAVFTFTIEGFLKLRKSKLAPAAVIALLRDAILAGNYQQAWEICQANPCFLSRVVGAALERVGKGREAFENVLADTSVKAAAKMKGNLNYLSVVGVVAPMFGLFGTVTGMIKAFKVLADSGAKDFGSLSSAISEALVTTAGGLVVGIPAFLLYYVIRTQGNKALADADTEANLLVEDIPVDQLYGVQVGFSNAEGMAAAPQQADPGYPPQQAY
ncbi:MAG: MotA/TolQ/ExbB proton channel family protein [Verrucomicrobiota bacterium]